MLSLQNLLKHWRSRGIVMIDILDCDIFRNNKSSLKETSKDDADKKDIKYMTSLELEVIDFDGVKNDYIKDLKLKCTPTSNDALCIMDNELYFIEFKNGKMDRKQLGDVKQKVYDSLLIFTDIINKGISYTRKNLNYILVYNKYHRPNPNEKLDKGEVQESRAYDVIRKNVNKQGKMESDIFLLKQPFEGIHLKRVDAFTIEEFEEKFVNEIEK